MIYIIAYVMIIAIVVIVFRYYQIKENKKILSEINQLRGYLNKHISEVNERVYEIDKRK